MHSNRHAIRCPVPVPVLIPAMPQAKGALSEMNNPPIPLKRRRDRACAQTVADLLVPRQPYWLSLQRFGVGGTPTAGPSLALLPAATTPAFVFISHLQPSSSATPLAVEPHDNHHASSADLALDAMSSRPPGALCTSYPFLSWSQ